MNMAFKKLLCGFDEAGRGPLAGPVSAACVVLPEDFPVGLLDDSKRLSPKKREAACSLIKEKACWGLAFVSHEEIDRINILNASLKAMSLAYAMLVPKLESWGRAHGFSGQLCSGHLCGIVDGLHVPDVSCECRSEVKADGRYPCVMAASILAKVERDCLMLSYDREYPGYGYAKHKGYPTKAHIAACRELGPSPIQRLSFSY